LGFSEYKTAGKSKTLLSFLRVGESAKIGGEISLKIKDRQATVFSYDKNFVFYIDVQWQENLHRILFFLKIKTPSIPGLLTSKTDSVRNPMYFVAGISSF
jgi:hypothetical protein